MALAAFLALVLFTLFALVAISLRANQTLPPSSKLPMQWGLDGRPYWSAPRRVALSFTPLLYLLTAVPMALLLPQQWGPEVPVMLGVFGVVAAGFIGGHIFHIWLIQRGR